MELFQFQILLIKLLNLNIKKDQIIQLVQILQSLK